MPKYRATVRDHPDWRDGDPTLISADGWRFKVLSAYVMSSSSVLRDALTYSTRSRVRFTEPRESKSVIARWLQLLVHVTIGGRRGHFRHPSHAYATPFIDIGTYIALIAFLRKWGCEQTLSHLCLLVTQALVNQDISRADAFTLGAAADNVLLCVNAMRLGNTRLYPSLPPNPTPPPMYTHAGHSRRSSLSALFGRSKTTLPSSQGHATISEGLASVTTVRKEHDGPLKVADLKLEHWRAIPPEYIFALGRAMREDDLEDPQRRGEHLETDFKKLLSCATAFFGRPDPALDRLTGEPVFLSSEEAEELDCAESQRVVRGMTDKRWTFP